MDAFKNFLAVAADIITFIMFVVAIAEHFDLL